MENKPFIYLSFAPADQAQAEETAEMLRSKFRVCCEPAHAGQPYDGETAGKVGSCGVFLALISEAYLASDACLAAMQDAVRCRKPRAGILLEPVPLPEITNPDVPQIPKYEMDGLTFCSRLRAMELLQPCRCSFSEYYDGLSLNERAALHVSVATLVVYAVIYAVKLYRWLFP